MTRSPHVNVVLTTLLVLLGPAFAYGQQAPPDPNDWADLLIETEPATAPTTPAAPNTRDAEDDPSASMNDLERIAREVRIVLMPIIDQAGDRDIAVGEALQEAASTIDYYLAKYRERIPTEAVTTTVPTSADINATNTPIVSVVADSSAVLPPAADEVTNSIDDRERSRDIISAAAAELRRIAAELESAATGGPSNN